MTNNNELSLGRKWLNALQVLVGVTPALTYFATWNMNEGNQFYVARTGFCVVMIGIWLMLIAWNGILRRRDRQEADDDD